jgi:hypothetical protein
MTKYRVGLGTRINLVVEIEAEDEEQAADEAWEHAEEYLRTVTGDSSGGRRVRADATLDGIGADEVEEVSP